MGSKKVKLLRNQAITGSYEVKKVKPCSCLSRNRSIKLLSISRFLAVGSSIIFGTSIFSSFGSDVFEKIPNFFSDFLVAFSAAEISLKRLLKVTIWAFTSFYEAFYGKALGK